jgi:hypothetical protein
MKLIWVIALVLAWPTAGLSLLAIPAVALVRAYMRGTISKTRSSYLAAERAAMDAFSRGEVHVPTWIDREPFRKQLFLETQKAAIEAGMTPVQAKTWLSPPIVAAAVTAAACFEKEGLGVLGQIAGAADFTKSLARMHLSEPVKTVRKQEFIDVPASTESAATASQDEDDVAGEDEDHEEGRRLFEAGMNAAMEFKCQEAIDFYTRSIEASGNPAPYINRANLLSKRIRHYEAMQDLRAAQLLDIAGEFSAQVRHELKAAQALTLNYRNGMRERLLADFDENDHRRIATAITRAAFGVKHGAYSNGNVSELVEYHFFNELDNIVKFENLKDYPEAEQWLADYPLEFVATKVDSCPDVEAYQKAEFGIHLLLCCYDEGDMRLLRRSMLYDIHRNLMVRDFGPLWDALNSECRGVTKEAEEFKAKM